MLLHLTLALLGAAAATAADLQPSAGEEVAAAVTCKGSLRQAQGGMILARNQHRQLHVRALLQHQQQCSSAA
jgi:hypothetical protein